MFTAYFGACFFRFFIIHHVVYIHSIFLSPRRQAPLADQLIL